MSITSARLVLRIGYRIVVVAGMVCLTLAFLLLSRWSASLTLAIAMRDALKHSIQRSLRANESTAPDHRDARLADAILAREVGHQARPRGQVVNREPFSGRESIRTATRP